MTDIEFLARKVAGATKLADAARATMAAAREASMIAYDHQRAAEDELHAAVDTLVKQAANAANGESVSSFTIDASHGAGPNVR